MAKLEQQQLATPVLIAQVIFTVTVVLQPVISLQPHASNTTVKATFDNNATHRPAVSNLTAETMHSLKNSDVIQDKSAINRNRRESNKLSMFKAHAEDVQLIKTSTRASEYDADGESAPVVYSFTAFHKRFNMAMQKRLRNNILHPEAVVTVKSSAANVTHRIEDLNLTFYSGTLQDGPDAGSPIHGTFIDDDVFEGIVRTSDEVYCLESSAKHSVGVRNNDDTRTTRVYRQSNISYPEELAHIACTIPKSHKIKPLKKFGKKRQSKRSGIYKPSGVCKLHVTVDHTFYERIAGSNVDNAIKMVTNHIERADYTFRMTDIDKDSKPDNIGFVISQIVVYTDSNYRMASLDLDSTPYLTKFSQYNFGAVCLAVSFTCRLFAGGVIGLAWAGDATENNMNGICQQPVLARPPEGGAAQLYTLNTLVVTQMLNADTMLPAAILANALSHEFGHSFGSYQHDDDVNDNSCVPGMNSREGNFIMYSKATTHLRTNNWKFSDCSKRLMMAVMRMHGDCLTAQQEPYCGNMVVENDEECDCGNEHVCALVDKCCVPPPVTSSDNPNSCSILRDRDYTCSPRVQRCCTTDCRTISAGTPCWPGDECTEAASCDGDSASCPKPRQKNGNCGEGGHGNCINGECSLSVCASAGLTDCRCTYSTAALCRVCCGCPANDTNKMTICLPADWLGLVPNRTTPLMHVPGHRCDDDGGMCNDNGYCLRRTVVRRRRTKTVL